MRNLEVIKRNLALFTSIVVGAASLIGCGSANPSSASAAEAVDNTKEVIHVVAATRGGPVPYITVDENDELDGYDIAVFRAVFEKLPQYDVELVKTDDALTGLTSGQYQISVNNWGYREERAETYYYSYPYDKVVYDFIQRADDEPLTSFRDASERGYKIEVGAGNNVTNALEAWNESNPDAQIELVYTESDILVLFEHILDGTSDFRIDDHPIFNAYKEQYDLQLQGNSLSDEEAQNVSSSLNAYFLFPKDEAGAALREDVNRVLKELKEDGTLKTLSEKYFGIDQSPDAADFEKVLN
ncbi:transporter substrate-binding domain-containing protein [Butyrivibrio sp. VCB2006]|uniref:transporter substrate-binding domain-containing protein n=1 Tax=Butyrivibrio sp. VCB2006 TaxID=1280679 RepID=UPI0004235ECC|nr:transporter substrate-binding domain-containing protein [Butyrivibrio sp. VCB2006]